MGGSGSKSPSEDRVVVNNNIVVSTNNVNTLESNFNINGIVLGLLLILAFVIVFRLCYNCLLKSLRKDISSQSSV